jgi:chromosome segregation ATPase
MESESLNLAAIIAGLLSAGVLFVNQLVPVFVRSIQRRREARSQEVENEITKGAIEDKLSIDAKTFLNQAAKEYFQTIKDIAEDCQEEVKELKKQISELESQKDELTTKLQSVNFELIQTKKAQTEAQAANEKSQAEIEKLRSNVEVLRTDMVNINTRADGLEKQVTIEQERNRTLERQLKQASTILESKDAELQSASNKIERLEKRVSDLTVKLLSYIERLRTNNLITPEDGGQGNTDELITDI